MTRYIHLIVKFYWSLMWFVSVPLYQKQNDGGGWEISYMITFTSNIPTFSTNECAKFMYKISFYSC